MRRLMVLALFIAAALPAAAHTLFLDIDGKRVEVEVSAPAANQATEDGRQVAVWKPEDAAKIAAELAAQDLAWAIPSTLGALRVGDRTPMCLTLDLEDGPSIAVTLPGKPASDEHGRIIWTPAQIEAIQQAFSDAGRDDALPRVFGLHRAHQLEATPLSDDPLRPGCGECLSGKVCSVSGSADCCAGTGTCTKCKVCPSKKVREALP